MSWQSLKESLSSLYGEQATARLFEEIKNLDSSKTNNNSQNTLNKNSSMLICYADSIVSKNKFSPIQALQAFIEEKELSNFMPQIHLLPFFPWDTDRGFSVKNFFEVDKRNGNWDDIKKLSKVSDLMFDFVANHASIENPLIQSALISKHLDKSHSEYSFHKKYKDFVISFDKETAPKQELIEKLSRPRANPVLTPYSVLEDENQKITAKLGVMNVDFSSSSFTELGCGLVWTTFSRGKDKDGKEDTRQVDLNFKNPLVFLESIKILQFYLSQGASLVRLDAIGYLWKILGSSSIHEKETHLLIHCIQETLNLLDINLKTIAEVNESQENVIPYLGTKEQPEADYIYQFTHFPLAVHAFTFNTAAHYGDWIKTLDNTQGRQFITVLGSHDGLGMKPLRGVLPEVEIEKLSEYLVEKQNALPNYAILPGGKKIIYEACSTPWDITNGSAHASSPLEAIEKYLSIVRLGLLHRGIPGFYINGLLASKSYLPSEGLDENRTINREQFDLESLTKTLEKDGIQSTIFKKIRHSIQVRDAHKAFQAGSPALISLEYPDKQILLIKAPSNSGKDDDILSVSNTSSDAKTILIPAEGQETGLDILSGDVYSYSSINLKPFQTIWLKSS